MANRPITAAPAATLPPTYATTALHFAAFLTTEGMQFIGVEYLEKQHRPVILFADPNNLGPSLLEKFKHSPFRDFVDAQKFLRSAMMRVTRKAELADVRPVPVR